MKFALDTNSVIYFLRGSFPALMQRMISFPSRMIAVPETVRAELLYGVTKSRQQEQNARRLNAFLEPLERLPFSGEAVEAYATIRCELERRGAIIGPNDLVIAATCLAHGATLITRNTREFERVPGLKTEDWTEWKSGNQRELWDLYDKNGKPLGRTVYRGDRLAKGEYHLVVQIWTRRTDGRYLIQKRAADLKNLPGVWTTTAGSVIAGEDCVTGATRELAEEIGVHADPQDLHQAFHRVGGDAIEFAWLLERDVPPGDIRLQKEEVAEVKWATAAEIQKMVDEGIFFNYGSEYFTAIFNH